MTDKTFTVVKPSLLIPTGTYTGVCANVEFRYEPYEYMDLVLNINGVPNSQETPQLKTGFSIKTITLDSEIGNLIKMFQEIKEGDTFNEQTLKNIFIGKVFKFDVVNAPSKKDPKKSYANIVKSTIKKA